MWSKPLSSDMAKNAPILTNITGLTKAIMAPMLSLSQMDNLTWASCNRAWLKPMIDFSNPHAPKRSASKHVPNHHMFDDLFFLNPFVKEGVFPLKLF